MLIFVLEKTNALWTYFHSTPQALLQVVWQKLYNNIKIVGILIIIGKSKMRKTLKIAITNPRYPLDHGA